MFAEHCLQTKPWLICALMALAVLSQPILAVAAPETLSDIRIADNIVPAPFGYEPAGSKFVVVEQTPIYVSPYIYPGTVDSTKLGQGTTVNILAKAKGYEWVLIERNGIGIGYVPLSRLSPAK